MNDLQESKQEIINDARRLGLYKLGFAPVKRWEENSAKTAILPGAPLPSQPRENYFPGNI